LSYAAVAIYAICYGSSVLVLSRGYWRKMSDERLDSPLPKVHSGAYSK